MTTLRSAKLIIISLLACLALFNATYLFSDCGFGYGISYTARLKQTDSPASSTCPFTHVSLWLQNWDEVWNKYWHEEQCDYAKKWSISVVVYGYLIAAYGKTIGLNDCDVSDNNLCTKGSSLLVGENWSKILTRYEYWSAQYAQAYGTTIPTLWNIEPDFFQYSVMGDSYSSFTQENPIPDADMATKWDEICTAIRKNLPSAKCGLDISPWLSSTDAPIWYAHFAAQKYDYLFTSGGRTAANNVLIRPENSMTWAQAHSYGANKPILADSGYGVGGGSDDSWVSEWQNSSTATARNSNGVMGVTISRSESETDYYIETAAKVSATQCKLPSTYSSSGPTNIEGENGNAASTHIVSILLTSTLAILAYIC